MTMQEALVMAKGNPVIAKKIYGDFLKAEADSAKIAEAVKTATKEAVKEIKEEAKVEAKATAESSSTDEPSDKMFGVIPKKAFWIGTGVIAIGTLLFIFRKKIF